MSLDLIRHDDVGELSRSGSSNFAIRRITLNIRLYICPKKHY